MGVSFLGPFAYFIITTSVSCRILVREALAQFTLREVEHLLQRCKSGNWNLMSLQPLRHALVKLAGKGIWISGEGHHLAVLPQPRWESDHHQRDQEDQEDRSENHAPHGYFLLTAPGRMLSTTNVLSGNALHVPSFCNQ